MYDLTIRDSFSSAHFLREYEGPCEKLHGHTWKTEVTIAGDKLDDIGLVVDFKVLKQQFSRFLESLDHVCLNDLPFFKEHNPSTENVARYIYSEFSKNIHPQVVKKVQVWESETASVTYYEETKKPS